MFSVSRRTLFVSCTGVLLTLLSSRLNAAQVSADDPAGLIWFVGSVTGLVDERASVDLGEAHNLRSGQALALFRRNDDHFVPLGILTIADSRPTWCLMEKSTRFQPRPGDVAIYVRSMKQLGTGEEYQDAFLKHQIASRGDRNGYSSLQLHEEAAVLQRFVNQQPRWVKEHKPVAGAIRSASVNRSALAEMQPLLNQILKFQEFQSQGVPVDKAVGAEWSLVLSTLVVREVGLPEPDATDGKPEPTETDPATELPTESTIPVESVRRQVDRIMFTRTPEERRVATLICTALEQFSPLHEKLWISQQLRSTQFASLATDVQLLLEYEAVLAQLRADQK